MKNLRTLDVVVNNGKVVLDLPEYSDGTKLKIQIISLEKILEEQLTDQFKNENFHEDINDDKIRFEDLDLIYPILEAITQQGYEYPTPIQVKAIPLALKGKDLLATAQTGSGKTAAFSLPMIQLLSNNPVKGKSYPRGLILSPTRELASQIGESIWKYSELTDIRHVTIYGGVNQKPQVRHLQRGKDIVVATPGRLLDLINQGHMEMDRIEIMVLDEADRMLDMGFIRDIRKIIKMIPDMAQIMLFSATMPKQILELADQILVNPENVAVDPPASTVDTIESSVFFVEKSDKFELLIHLLYEEKINKALIFSRTKHGANKIVKKLLREHISASAIHGNKSQSAREKALSEFKNNEIQVLVATDIAARGIDIDDITHVINFDMSNEEETYVHRIGRTARAGKSGKAYNFCDESERPYLMAIERLTQKHLIRAENYPFMSRIAPPKPTDLEGKQRKNKSSYKRSRNERNSNKQRRYSQKSRKRNTHFNKNK